MKDMILKSYKSVQAVLLDMLSKTADIISPRLCASTCFAQTFSVMFYFMHLQMDRSSYEWDSCNTLDLNANV